MPAARQQHNLDPRPSLPVAGENDANSRSVVLGLLIIEDIGRLPSTAPGFKFTLLVSLQDRQTPRNRKKFLLPFHIFSVLFLLLFVSILQVVYSTLATPR